MINFLIAYFPGTFREVLAVTIALILVRILVRWWRNPLRKIPGPPGWPIIGNTLDFSVNSDVHAMLVKRAKLYGPIYKDSTLFGKY